MIQPKLISVRNRQTIYSEIEQLIVSYYLKYDLLPIGGLIIDKEITAAKFNLFNKAINLNPYFEQNQSIKKSIFIKVFYRNNELYIQFYYDKQGKYPLKGKVKKPVLIYIVKEIDGKLTIKNFDQYCIKYLEDSAKDLFYSREKYKNKYIKIPYPINTTGPTFFKTRRNLDNHFKNIPSNKVAYYLSIKENPEGDILLQYFYDSNYIKHFYDDILIEEEGVLKPVCYTEYQVYYFEKFIINSIKSVLAIPAYSARKLMGDNPTILPGITRNLSDYYQGLPKEQRGAYLMLEPLEKNLFQLNYFYDADYKKPLYSKVQGRRKIDIVKYENEKIIILDSEKYWKSENEAYILAIIAKGNDINEKYKPIKLIGKAPGLFDKQIELRIYFEDNELREYVSYGLPVWNASNDLELHYFYDSDCQQPLISKIQRKQKIDYLLKDFNISRIPKKKSVEDLLLNELIVLQSEDMRRNYEYQVHISFDEAISPNDYLQSTKHKILGSRKYSPEYLLFEHEKTNIDLRNKLLDIFKKSLFYLINAQTIEEIIYKYINYNSERLPAANYNYFNKIEYSKDGLIDHFYDRVVEYFKKKYLEYHIDEDIAQQFNLSLDDVQKYNQECEEILYSEYFNEEILSSGLLNNTIDNFCPK